MPPRPKTLSSSRSDENGDAGFKIRAIWADEDPEAFEEARLLLVAHARLKKSEFLCGDGILTSFLRYDLLDMAKRVVEPDLIILVEHPTMTNKTTAKQRPTRARNLKGFVVGHIPTRTTLYVDLICAARGWGTRLMQKVDAEARRRQLSRLQLAAVKGVVAFYRSLGFVNSRTCAESKSVQTIAAKLPSGRNVATSTRYQKLLNQLVRQKLTKEDCDSIDECDVHGFVMTKCLKTTNRKTSPVKRKVSPAKRKTVKRKATTPAKRKTTSAKRKTVKRKAPSSRRRRGGMLGMRHSDRLLG